MRGGPAAQPVARPCPPAAPTLARVPPRAPLPRRSPAGRYTDGLHTADSVCRPCPAGSFRSGDAAPENNACHPIPAGYLADANSGARAVSPCPRGTASYWTDESTRVPDQAARSTACQPCAEAEGGAATYAPREGMAACLPCAGGWHPTKSDAQLEGADQCSECGQNTYRSFYTAE